MRQSIVEAGGVNGGGVDSVIQMLGKSAVRTAVVTTEATFTGIAVSDNGGKARLTGSGAHGLTTAVSVTPGYVNLYVISGTGWVPGLHRITGIDADTTGVVIDLDTDYDAGLGTPTVAVAGDDVPLAEVVVPPLSANSVLEIDYTGSGPVSSNNKVWRVGLAGTNFTGVVTTTSPVLTHRLAIANRGATNAQTASMNTSNNTGYGVGSALPVTGSIDTSVSTILRIIADPATANEVMVLERYHVVLFP